ncbi:MAG: CPXCG motif-containing cysteine-rich protein [Elusimicrobia bacterium]|nr:CPXCG motif-containing cysteine-rich protein [Elusimicrobiota bacterium]
MTAQPETEHQEEDLSVACPYCGEEFEVHVTSEEDGQTMYEDCEVCCRPISLHVHTEEGELQIEAYRS